MARIADASGNFPAGVNGADPDTGAAEDDISARQVVDVVPSDTLDIPTGCHSIFVGGAGNLTYLDKFGTSHLVTAVAANTQLRIAPKRIMATGTTATLIQAYY